MKTVSRRIAAALAALGLLAASASTSAQSLVEQWRNGLAGSRLTAYSGSAISSNSTLTIIRFCANGRYVYQREGSWTAPSVGGGASQSTINGQWDVQAYGGQVHLVYVTDQGQRGSFPVYLQNNGRVNIGGLAYAVERGAAGC